MGTGLLLFAVLLGLLQAALVVERLGPRWRVRAALQAADGRLDAPLWQVFDPAPYLLGSIELNPLQDHRLYGRLAPNWRNLREEHLSTYTPARPREPGVPRLVWLGHSTPSEGAPSYVVESLAHRGLPRVQVLHRGSASLSVQLSSMLLHRLHARWQPDLVLVHHGSNDVLRETGRLTALALQQVPHVPPPGTPLPGGLGTRWLESSIARAERLPLLQLANEAKFAPALGGYWRIARLGWRSGFRVAVSTYPTPDFQRLAEGDRLRFAGELAFQYGIDEPTYVRELARFNDELRRFADESGVLLVDVARGPFGEAGAWWDVAHLSTPAQVAHAEIVAERVDDLLREPPTRTIELRSPEPLAWPEPGPETSPGDGAGCVRGPCPNGACFVPAATFTTGHSDEVRQARREALMRRFGGVHPRWLADTSPRTVELSAFCINSRPVPPGTHRDCVAAGACPPLAAPGGMVPTRTDAEALCAFRGGRLPTESEWERAASLDLFTPAASEEAPFEWVADCAPLDATDARPPAGLRDPVRDTGAGCEGLVVRVSPPPIGIERRAEDEGLADSGPRRRQVRCVRDFGTVPSVYGGPTGALLAGPDGEGR